MATETEVQTAAPVTTRQKQTNITIPGRLSATGLALPVNLSYESWAEVGKTLGALRGVSQWAIGDWLVYGEHSYGEKFAQAADVTGLNPESLQVYQWISSRVPMEIRHPELTHAHHQVVAKLEPEDMQKWLDTASKKNWSVAELRAALREKRAKAAAKEGTETNIKFKVSLEFVDDPGEEFLGKLEAYVGREGGSIKKAGW